MQRDRLQKACISDNSNSIQANNETLQQIYGNFSSTCKRYTDIMLVKNHLQCHVFKMISNATSNIVSQLIQLIIKLQIAAVKLQKLEVSDLLPVDIVYYICNRE